MPITQDRLINLIDTTDEALAWCRSIRAVVETDADVIIASLNAAKGSGDFVRIDLAIDAAIGFVSKVINATSDKVFPWHLIERLAEERAHFRLTKRRNDVSKEAARTKRERLQKQINAEIDSAMEQKLRSTPPVAIVKADVNLKDANGTDITAPPPVEVGKPIL